MARKPTRSPKPRDNPRRGKKKISVLTQEKIEYVDYKDVNVLRRFMSDRAKIRARRVTGNDTQQQREIARAIKNAREMALVPYTNRVTTQRGGNRRDGERGSRADGPAPRPSGPPPGRGDSDDLDLDIDDEFDDDDDIDDTEDER
jgi:small subunit ribosomal protein S18